MKHSKRYGQASKKIEKDKAYPIEQALKLVQEEMATKFDGSVEAHIKLGIDPGRGEQQVRGAITLPHGTGKTKTITAIVNSEKEKEAKEAGADKVGGEDLIDQIKKTTKIDTDIVLATPEMMPKLALVAKILGPRGLMPTPKNETITTDLKKTITELKQGKVNFKNDDTGNIHQVIGKVSFEITKLNENFTTLLTAIKKAKPSSTKGIYLQNISISSTMGPGIKVEV
jgi:large subunit ribosomal protein L1